MTAELFVVDLEVIDFYGNFKYNFHFSLPRKIIIIIVCFIKLQKKNSLVRLLFYFFLA